VLADAQTSGGLLMAVDPAAADALLADLHARGVAAAARIGMFTDSAGRIAVT
jgi:selenide,water dikinase